MCHSQFLVKVNNHKLSKSRNFRSRRQKKI